MMMVMTVIVMMMIMTIMMDDDGDYYDNADDHDDDYYYCYYVDGDYDYDDNDDDIDKDDYDGHDEDHDHDHVTSLSICCRYIMLYCNCLPLTAQSGFYFSCLIFAFPTQRNLVTEEHSLPPTDSAFGPDTDGMGLIDPAALRRKDLQPLQTGNQSL